MTARRSMSTTRRARIFTLREGRCAICGQSIDGTRDPWDIDHRLPLALGGSDEDDNLEPVHRRCHRGAGSKTSADVATIAKAKRVAAKFINAQAPSRRPLPGGRQSRLKRTVDGRVVQRE